jgi:hypothetical protein
MSGIRKIGDYDADERDKTMHGRLALLCIKVINSDFPYVENSRKDPVPNQHQNDAGYNSALKKVPVLLGIWKNIWIQCKSWQFNNHKICLTTSEIDKKAKIPALLRKDCNRVSNAAKIKSHNECCGSGSASICR